MMAGLLTLWISALFYPSREIPSGYTKTALLTYSCGYSHGLSIAPNGKAAPCSLLAFSKAERTIR